MSDLKVEISEAQIQNAIAVAISESLAPEKRDEIIRNIVRAHLSVKLNSYSSETLLSAEVGNVIRGMVAPKLQAIVKEMEPEVNAMVEKCLGPGFKAGVLDHLQVALESAVVSGIRFRVELTPQE